MKQAEFREAYRQARSEVVSQTVTQLQHNSLQAVQTLGAISANESAAPTARVSAARAILELSFRATEGENLSSRLEALEKMTHDLDRQPK